MRHAAQTVEQAPVNSALLNVVTPMGLSFEKNRLSIGENIGKAYGIIRYPQKVDVEWLSKLTNIPSTLVSIGFKPVDNGTLINAISRSVVQQRGLADGAKDPLSRQRAEKAAEDGEKIIMQIDRVKVPKQPQPCRSWSTCMRTANSPALTAAISP